MANDRSNIVPSNDRSMATTEKDGGELFFFPKRTPPVSVRAASREAAEELIAINGNLTEENNPQDS